MRYRAQAMVSAAAAPAVGQDRRGVVEIQTGFGADAPAMVYEVDGDESIAIVTGGNSPQGSANGDALWAFSLKGPLTPLYPPPSTKVGPCGPVAAGVDKIRIADLNAEYAYFPARTEVKAGPR
jgi:alcohol dehydrogenase (cytochrome c)